MTLQQLEYIVALDQHRNFVKAAESCFVTQPTLTMQLAKLEEQYDIQIFDRTKKPIQPTEIGKVFIAKSHEIILRVKELKNQLSEEKNSMNGNFRLGIIPTLAPYILPLFLPDFSLLHPNTHLSIVELQSEMIIQALENNSLDLALIVTPLEEKQLREIPIFYEPFLAFLPEGHVLSDQEKIEHNALDYDNLLILSEGHCFRNQTLAICKPTKQLSTATFDYQSGSIEALKNLVLKGMGYTLVPELSVSKDDLKKGNIKRFIAPEPSREVSLVTHTSFLRENLINELISTIRKNLPKNIIQTKPHIRIKWRD